MTTVIDSFRKVLKRMYNIHTTFLNVPFYQFRVIDLFTSIVSCFYLVHPI